MNNETYQPKLCLHAGAEEVSRAALSGVIIPAATRSYSPLPYNNFVDMVQDELADIGFRFGGESHAIMKADGSRYFGIANLLNGSDNEQHALTVGMRSSLDKSIAPAIAFGSAVFVCDNMAFTGEVTIKRKQTRFINQDIRPMIADAVGRVKGMRDNQNRRFEIYQDSNITTAKAGAVICEMFRRGVINPQRMGKVIQEWDTPSFEHGDRTAWRLFNAATEALKGSPVIELPTKTIKLQTLIDEVTGADTRLKLAA
jgi:hypothetical protein